MPSSGISPHCGFSPTVPHAAEGSRIEQPVSEPMPRSASPPASAAALPDDEPPVVLPGWRRVVDGAVPRVRAEHAPGELGQVGLADDDGAGIEHPLDDRRVRVRDVVAVDPRAVGRPHAGRVDQVLDEERASRRAALRGTAQRLVEPGDRGVVQRVVSSRRHHRHALDLDLRPRDHERRDLDERRGRARIAEHLLPHRVDRAAGRSRP